MSEKPYKLFCTRESYAMTAHVMLEELGLDYEPIWSDLSLPPAQRDPTLLAANPHGRVPTLITPEGPIFETGAILVYLAERFPGAGLMPDPGDPSRRLFWQWHFYLATFFQREAFIQSVPALFLPEAARDELLTVSMERLRGVWQVLDQATGAGPYLLGERYSTCDISFALQALWEECQPPEGLDAYPNARRCLMAVLDRPACRAVLRAHDAERLARIA